MDPYTYICCMHRSRGPLFLHEVPKSGIRGWPLMSAFTHDRHFTPYKNSWYILLNAVPQFEPHPLVMLLGQGLVATEIDPQSSWEYLHRRRSSSIPREFPPPRHHTKACHLFVVWDQARRLGTTRSSRQGSTPAKLHPRPKHTPTILRHSTRVGSH